VTTSRCPACQAEVLRPAREGGVVLLSKVARLEPDGTIVLRCPQPGCHADLEVRNRVVLRLRLRTPLSATTLGGRADLAK
jgi:hypothetical protein